jgi:hypothetical protein
LGRIPVRPDRVGKTGAATVCAPFPGLLTEPEREELLAEATAHRPGALRTDRPGWRVVMDEQFLGPARYWYSLEGDARFGMQHRLASRVTEKIRVQLQPVQSNYLYYGDGDFLGLHHDQARCPFTVIALLDGAAEPLCVHHELIGVPAAELGPLVAPGGHRGGQTMDLHDGPVIIAGVVPHHRVEHRGSELLTIATFCFAPVS